MLYLLMGQFITVFGSQIYSFAVSYYILRETGSGLLYGVSLALGMLPQFLCSPVAGVFSDWYNRKKIIVITDAISGLFLLLVFFIISAVGMNIYYIYFLMFVLPVLGVFNAIALQAALPNAVRKDKLSRLNSLSQSVSSFSRIAAPLIGGIIILRVNIRLFLLLNAISFFIASILEYSVVFTETTSRINKTSKRINLTKIFKELKESHEYCKHNTLIYLIIAFMICMNFLFQFSFTVPIPYIINNTLDLSSKQYGIIQGMTSFGALLTALIMSRIFKAENSKRLLIRAITAMSLLLILMGAVTMFGDNSTSKNVVFLFFVALNFMFGGSIVASNIPINVILQTTSEDSYRGRVMGLSSMLSSAITPCAVILSGALLDYDRQRPYFLCFGGGAILLILVAIMAGRKEMKNEYT